MIEAMALTILFAIGFLSYSIGYWKGSRDAYRHVSEKLDTLITPK